MVAGDEAYPQRRGINSSVFEELKTFLKVAKNVVTDQDHVCAVRGQVWSCTDLRPIGTGLIG